ncbi:MAG: SDR family oxidoreductase [Variovorax sp.]|nr:MAG: SDR family oxidoreductase [Variovorax sp.]
MDASALDPVRIDSGALLAGRMAVISGAGRPRGIGRATARLFMAHGARVALLDVDEEETRAAAADLNQTTGTDHARGWACNVADAAACAAAIDGVLAWSGGRLDVLVNNAGLTQKRGVAEISEADYDTITDVVLRGTLLLSQAALPAMRARHGGSIVNVSSMSAQQGGGIFGGAHYCAAKAGVLGLTRAMARELGSEGIRVNAIAPGLVLTDFSRTGRSDDDKHASGAGWPLPRAGHAAEIAGACLFLASDLSSYVTGTTIDVNGGAHMR